MLFGDYRVSVIPDTDFRLDGGAMFGVIPRVLWERVSPPDDFNRIRLNMNCVLIETADERILIETGIGEKWTEKETRIYGIERQKSFAQTLYEVAGIRPDDITMVINTHLHFDHAGGNTVLERGTQIAERGINKENSTAVHSDSCGKTDSIAEVKNPHSAFGTPHSFVPQFTNAKYLVSKTEYDHACSPHERDRASYLPENWQPLFDSGQLELMPETYEPAAGLTIQKVRGHSETMQTWRLDRGGRTLYGFADLIPTRHHVPPAWIMGYDLYPTETLAFKKETLPQAVREGWLCLFYHDPDFPVCRLIELEGKVAAVPVAEDGSKLDM